MWRRYPLPAVEMRLESGLSRVAVARFSVSFYGDDGDGFVVCVAVILGVGLLLLGRLLGLLGLLGLLLLGLAFDLAVGSAGLCLLGRLLAFDLSVGSAGLWLLRGLLAFDRSVVEGQGW